MIEALRNWIVSITTAAIVTSISVNITPEGPVKRIVRLTGGLIMMLVILNPLISIQLDSLASYISKYQLQADWERTGIEIENIRIMELIIEEKTEAYILDKANLIGFDCKVEIRCKTGENGYPYPYSVTIYGEPTPDQKSELAAYIETNLAVPGQRQEWMPM